MREIGQGAAPASPQDSACANLGVQNCGRDPGCSAMSGRRLDRARNCWTASEPLGCRVSGLLCGALLTAARDPGGACHLFPSTCVPVGWAPVDASKDKSCHPSTAVCEPP
jgi:hypothetical protein